MLSSELEFCLNEAFQRARDRRHEFMTVEHLLLALLEIPRVHEILKACNSNMTELRRQLTEFVEEQTPLLAGDDDTDVQPTLGFQRVLQRAVFHVQSSGKKEVAGSNVLVAIFSEKQSQAVYYLNLQDVTRLDVINYISRGMPQLPVEGGNEEEATSVETEAEPEATPLERYTTNLNQQAVDGKIDPLIGREVEIERTVQILCRRRKNNPLYVGDAGVGKTALAEHIAQALGRPLMVRRASDIASKFVGETEQNMARMFDTAQTEGAVLLLDEADSFLRSRKHAERNYEVSEVNEMLAGMERFHGLFICTTNLFDDLDEAALRRFAFKIRFKALKPEQRVAMFEREAGAAPTDEQRSRLVALDCLTHGDFAAVRHQVEILGEAFTPDEFLAQLEAEHRAKPEVRERRGMGFRSN